jgi:hypothetical protein
MKKFILLGLLCVLLCPVAGCGQVIDPDGYKPYIEENEQAFQKERERQRQ